MPKILIAGGVAFVAVFGCAGADAMGGGNSSPWESPYAILEPQTVAPQSAQEPERIEGRSTFEGESDGAPQPHHARARDLRRHRQATTLGR